MAGDNTKGHPPATKMGDAIHVFKGGSIQMLTDVSIDPAGNVWAANNWNDLNGATAPDPFRPTSTWGGGSGITVIYGSGCPGAAAAHGNGAQAVKIQRTGPHPFQSGAAHISERYITKIL